MDRNLAPYVMSKVMQYDQFKAELQKCSQIYDVFGVIGRYVLDHVEEIVKFTEWTNANEQNNKQCARIAKAIESYKRNEQLPLSDFISYLISIFDTNEFDGVFYAYSALLAFDNFSEVKANIDSLPRIIGPLTASNSMNVLQIYPTPPTSFQDKIMTKMKIRVGRNTIIFNPSNPLNNFRNLLFIPQSELGEYQSYICLYNPITEKKEKKLRIAIFPLGWEPWFDVQYNEIGKTFSCINDNEQINKAVCYAIKRAALLDSDIVVFPEMTMNKNTKQEVKSYLLENREIGKKVSLIYLGTHWSDSKNVGCLLTGNASEVYSINKQVAFQTFRDGIIYDEELSKREKNLFMLDVPCWGRLSWYICRDYLSDELSQIYTRFGTNLQLISAYSNKLNEMMNKALAECLTHGKLSIVSNYCFRLEENKSQFGFVAIPKMIEKQLISPDICKAEVKCNHICKGIKGCGWQCIIDEDLKYTFSEITY